MSTTQTETTEADLSAFMTLNEAASTIGCTRRFLEKRILDGEIAVFHPSARMLRIRRSEFERWIAAFTHGTEGDL